MSKTKLFDCINEHTDIELESTLAATTTLTVARYLNFIQDGGNSKYTTIENKMAIKTEAEDKKKKAEKEERKICDKIKKNLRKKEEKNKRREERGYGKVIRCKDEDEIVKARLGKDRSSLKKGSGVTKDNAYKNNDRRDIKDKENKIDKYMKKDLSQSKKIYDKNMEKYKNKLTTNQKIIENSTNYNDKKRKINDDNKRKRIDVGKKIKFTNDKLQAGNNNRVEYKKSVNLQDKQNFNQTCQNNKIKNKKFDAANTQQNIHAHNKISTKIVKYKKGIIKDINLKSHANTHNKNVKNISKTNNRAKEMHKSGKMQNKTLFETKDKKKKSVYYKNK
ncbi:hypothetical protein COBT_001839 [Conglomerata obtusa]